MGKFKKGDKVLDNGKKSGHTYPVVGTIIEVSPPDSWLWYRVKFPDGKVEEFHKGELKRATKGAIKPKEKSFKVKIKELIKDKNELTRSDLQGVAQAIASGKTGTDWKLEMEVTNRILIIIDNSDNFNAKQIEYHINQLEGDIARYSK